MLTLKKKNYFFLAFLIALLVSGCAAKKETLKEEENAASQTEAEGENQAPVYLSYAPDFESMHSFQRLVELERGSEEYEAARIEYLLERVRETPYNFVRNGEKHGAGRAAIHLRYKWVKYRDEAKTAELFARDVASGSRASGRPYYLQIEDKFYLIETVLYNELNLLEQGLFHYREKMRLLAERKAEEEKEEEAAQAAAENESESKKEETAS